MVILLFFVLNETFESPLALKLKYFYVVKAAQNNIENGKSAFLLLNVNMTVLLFMWKEKVFMYFNLALT